MLIGYHLINIANKQDVIDVYCTYVFEIFRLQIMNRLPVKWHMRATNRELTTLLKVTG